jgi:ankyrin repeat protein
MERALAQVHWAVRSDNVEALKRLLDGEEGLELIDGADYDKRTPLHVAASNNSVAAAQLLLSAGAARDPLDRWNSTPLANAQERGFKSMVKLLKQYGAPIGLSRTRPKSTSNAARSSGKARLVRFGRLPGAGRPSP